MLCPDCVQNFAISAVVYMATYICTPYKPLYVHARIIKPAIDEPNVVQDIFILCNVAATYCWDFMW